MTELVILLGCYLWVGVSSLLCKRYLSSLGTVTRSNWWKTILLWPVEFVMLYRDKSF